LHAKQCSCQIQVQRFICSEFDLRVPRISNVGQRKNSSLQTRIYFMPYVLAFFFHRPLRPVLNRAPMDGLRAFLYVDA
jgi:hypothetical protein